MAETAPLTSVSTLTAMQDPSDVPQAHSHARKAAEQTQQTDWSGAANEHQCAARDFARAARTTNDSEALRVLRLLENQHIRLARIISLPDTTDERLTDDVETEARQTAPVYLQEAETSVSASSKAKSSPAQPSSMAVAAARIGSQVRESSPSLARDIASRRGIPQTSRTPPSPAAQARVRQLSPELQRRVRGATPPKIPPSITDSQASLRSQRTARKRNEDEGFTRFYSSLSSGAASKLSSVLAYAGLPLIAEDPPAEPSPPPRTKSKSVPSGSDPDVKKYFSKAALRAIEDEHRQKGTLGHGFGPAESFYVVPQGGGSYSYADITKNRLQAAGSSGVTGDDEDDFVDASEIPGPPSPTQNRGTKSLTGGQKRNPFGKQRTDEELDLENATLKLTLEQLAARLANFEAHAQDASMAALTQSMMGARPTAPSADAAALQERVRQLEQQIEHQAEGEQKLRDQAEEQRKMLRSYEARYAKLKLAAKAKDKAKREAAEKAGKGMAVGEEAEGDVAGTRRYGVPRICNPECTMTLIAIAFLLKTYNQASSATHKTLPCLISCMTGRTLERLTLATPDTLLRTEAARFAQKQHKLLLVRQLLSPSPVADMERLQGHKSGYVYLKFRIIWVARALPKCFAFMASFHFPPLPAFAPALHVHIRVAWVATTALLRSVKTSMRRDTGRDLRRKIEGQASAFLQLLYLVVPVFLNASLIFVFLDSLSAPIRARTCWLPVEKPEGICQAVRIAIPSHGTVTVTLKTRVRIIAVVPSLWKEASFY
nr:hypothetical protein CFP56_24470 [Quercus suber]